jgi:DNA (cytosine-5)-methyltransferase 1
MTAPLAYYNEHDPKAAAWLRELISRGLIADGVVDERSITDVDPDDLEGFTQVHLFAGIGGWSLALRMAGWPDDRPVWTGSCPCQPFSVAGKGKGENDERHLWPEMWRLIAFRRPSVVFGEQVASKAGRGWLAGVCADLEALGYRTGAADLCAAGVGAPHIRQRLYWVAYADKGECGRLTDGEGRERDGEAARWEQGDGEPQSGCNARGLADAVPAGRPERRAGAGDGQASGGGCAGRVGDAGQPGLEGHAGDGGDRDESGRLDALTAGSIAAPGRAGFWSDYSIIPCRDGKARRTQSGIFPLAARIPGGLVSGGDPSVAEANHSAEARVMRLRGYGNAINAYVGAEFLRAYLEVDCANKR